MRTRIAIWMLALVMSATHAAAYTGCPGNGPTNSHVVVEYIFHEGSGATAFNTGTGGDAGNATLTNGVTWSSDVPPANTNCGYSVSLPATGSGATTPASETAGSYDPLAGATNFTIMAWVRRESLTISNNTAARIASDISALGTNASGFEFRFSGTNGVLWLNINGIERNTTVGGIRPNSNAWHHVAVVYDGTRPATNTLTRNVHFYIDGVQRGDGNTLTNLMVGANTNRLTVGNSSVSRGVLNTLVGKIDDVRILRGFAPAAVGDGKTNTTILCYRNNKDDFEPPTITCPANKTVSTDAGQCYASGVALGSPTAGDNCGAVTVTNNAPATFPRGTTVVTWTVTDAAGNSTNCQQRVTVVDNEPPMITCADVTVSADPGRCSASNVNVPPPTTSDNCAVVSVLCRMAQVELRVGTNNYAECEVTDAAGNRSSCWQRVIVIDVADSDGDGLTDCNEISQHGTDPYNRDTDGDELPDGWEITYGLSPTSTVGADGATGDPDNDGYTNRQEYNFGTDPDHPESYPSGIPANLIGWWTFDEGSGLLAADSSGNGRSAILSTNPSPAWVTGALSNAVSFAATNDVVTVAHDEGLNLTNTLSISLWLYLEELPTASVSLLSKGGGWGSVGFQLNTYDIGPVARFELDNVPLDSETILTTGVWYHVAATWDGYVQRIYINGVLDAEEEYPWDIGTNDFPISMGRVLNPEHPRSLKGKLDDVRLYGRGISSNEVTALFSVDTDGDGMPNWWEFANGLNPEQNDANGDPDGDRIVNLYEYQYGTNPHGADVLDIIVNGGNLWTSNRAIVLDPLTVPYPLIIVSLEPSMVNPTILTNAHAPFLYELPDTNNVMYYLHIQYASAATNALGPVIYRPVALDTVPPVVQITSPTTNAVGVGNQRFIHLQATAYDPNGQGQPDQSRRLKIWVNGERYWQRQGTLVDIPQFALQSDADPAETITNVIVVAAEDWAGNRTEAALTWLVNTGTDTNTPVLSDFNLQPGNGGAIVLPDMSEVWLDGWVDDENATVTALINGGESLPLNLRTNLFGAMLPLAFGTNTVLVTARDAAGHSSSNLLTLVRTDRYRAVATAVEVWNADVSNTVMFVGGYVSAKLDEGSESEASLVEVRINNIVARLYAPDGNGNVVFRTDSPPVPGPAVGSYVVATATLTYSNGESFTVPLRVVEGYELLRVKHMERSEHAYFGRLGEGGCAPNQRALLSVDERKFDLLSDQYPLAQGFTRAYLTTTRYERPAGNPCFSYPDTGSIGWTVSSISRYEYRLEGWLVPHLRWGISKSGVEGKFGPYAPFFGLRLDTSWHDGELVFVPPVTYGTNTPTLLTFEGVNYARPPGVALDLSQVKYLGQDPVTWNNEHHLVSYLVPMDRRQVYVVNANSFDWPGYHRQWSYWTYDHGTIFVRDEEHWLYVRDFHNQQVSIQVSPNPFEFCVSTNTHTFTASGAPGTLTYSWSSSGEIVSTSGNRNENALIKFTTPSSNATVTATAGPVSGMATGIVQDIWIDHITWATVPSDRTRTTIGVGEEVTLNLVPCPGAVTWELVGPGTISSTNVNPITFTAAGQASSPTVTATQNGIQRSVTFDVKEPTGYDHADFYSTGDPAYSLNTAGASMKLVVTMAPTSVSFYRVQMGELTNAATSISGYFTNFPPASLAHTTAGHFWQLDETNQWRDSCWAGGFPAPWAGGSLAWVIPWRWFVPGYSTNYMVPWNQTFTIDANGTMSISKFGKTVTRTTNDVITTSP